MTDEHNEQPLRLKREETELPGECLHSSRALHIRRAAAVDRSPCRSLPVQGIAAADFVKCHSNRFLLVLAAAIDANKSGVNPTKRSSTSRSCFEVFERAAAFNRPSGKCKGLPKGVQLSTKVSISD